MHRYTFDAKLFCNVSITARTEDDARKILTTFLESLEPEPLQIAVFNEKLSLAGTVGHIVEVPSLSPDDDVYPQGAELTEVDGEDPDE